MAITVQHQPNAEILANAGYTAGAGMYQQAMQEMQQRERMQMRQIQASNQQAAMNRQFTLLRDNMQNQQFEDRQAQNFRNQAAFAEQQDKLIQNRMKMERDMQVEQMQMQMQNRLKEQRLGNEQGIARDQAKFMFESADDVIGKVDQMLAAGLQFTPQQQVEYDKIQQDITRINKDDSLTPVARARHLYELSQQLPYPKVSQAPLDQQFRESTFEVTEPDGTVKRYQRISRNGEQQWAVLDELQPKKPEELAAQKMPSWSFISDPTQMIKLRSEIVKSLTQEKQVAGGPGEKGTTVTQYPTSQQVTSAIQEYLDFIDKQYETRFGEGRKQKQQPQYRTMPDGSVQQWMDE